MNTEKEREARRQNDTQREIDQGEVDSEMRHTEK
jgi:hypothetical protein